MRVLRIVGGIVVMLGGMGFLFKAGGPSRYGHYSGPTAGRDTPNCEFFVDLYRSCPSSWKGTCAMTHAACCAGIQGGSGGVGGPAGGGEMGNFRKGPPIQSRQHGGEVFLHRHA